VSSTGTPSGGQSTRPASPVAKVCVFLPIPIERNARDQLLAAAQVQGKVATSIQEILFVCVHDAGRSQMAAAWARHLSAGKVHVRSAGSQPDRQIHPAAIQALAERGIEVTEAFPKPLTDDVLRAADVILTMGCGEACPVLPGKRYEDWCRRPRRPTHRGGPGDPRRHPGPRRDPAWRDPAPDLKGNNSDFERYSFPMAEKPSVLFVCVHNAGRSQMAAGFLTHLSSGQVEVRSAGSIPGDQVNPSAVAAMAEVGIDISQQIPKVLTTDAVQACDVVITMGCGDACPILPGKLYLDWALEDPAGQGVEAVRPIRDEIKARVQTLLVELLPDPSPTSAADR
jgi:arsenate reductase